MTPHPNFRYSLSVTQFQVSFLCAKPRTWKFPNHHFVQNLKRTHSSKNGNSIRANIPALPQFSSSKKSHVSKKKQSLIKIFYNLIKILKCGCHYVDPHLSHFYSQPIKIHTQRSILFCYFGKKMTRSFSRCSSLSQKSNLLKNYFLFVSSSVTNP